jgi:hypothetical protein
VPAPVRVDGLLRIWAPAVLVVGIVGGLLLAAARKRVYVRPGVAARKSWVLVIVWLVLPPLTLYGVSAVTSSQILATRYFLSAIPALALLAGWAIRAVRPAPARQVVALLVAALSILAYARLQHGLWFEDGVAEDWRGAAAAERTLVTDPHTPVLVQAGFIESTHIGWLKNPEKRRYLLSPLSIYPMTGHVIPLPYRLNRSAENYLVPVTNRYLLSTNRFLLLTRVSFNSYLPWFDGRLRGAGFESRSAGQFGSVTLVVFERH